MHGKALADAEKDIQGGIKRMKNAPFIFTPSMENVRLRTSWHLYNGQGR